MMEATLTAISFKMLHVKRLPKSTLEDFMPHQEFFSSIWAKCSLKACLKNGL